jgi:hypothetical protein
MSKTRTVSVWPDGRRHIWTKENGAYWWRPGAGSFPYAQAKENAEADGATVIREPIAQAITFGRLW